MLLKIRVENPMYSVRERYAYPIEQYNTFIGEPYPSPKWVGKEQFCLSNPGNKKFPFRVIDRDSIVDGWRLK